MGVPALFAMSGHAAEVMAPEVRGHVALAAPPLRLDVQKQWMAPALTLLPRPSRVTAAVPGSCEYSQAALCYNYQSGNAVYRPSRKLMPEISGMQRESVSLKRDKITFRYSFK